MIARMAILRLTYLEQGGDSESGNAAVDIRDEILQVQVTGRHRCWVLHRHLYTTTQYCHLHSIAQTAYMGTMFQILRQLDSDMSCNLVCRGEYGAG